MDKKISLNGFSLACLFIVFSIAILYLGYQPQQNDFLEIIIPYSIAFGIYVFLAFWSDCERYFLPLILLAVFIRACLVFSFPNLSDDIYRFLWDANLIIDGKNPYLFLPTDVVTDTNQALFDQLNSQEYNSPYPPISQIVYTTSALISGGDYYIFSVIIKAMTFIAELGSLYFIIRLLEKLKLSRHKLFIYALNPLILIELMGNLHFESFMILFVLMTVYFLTADKPGFSAVSFVAAIMSKLLPLMFTPFVLAYLGIRKSIKFSLVGALVFLILALPILQGMLDGAFFSSVGLYFQKFEFNASLYYLIRSIGYSIYGYNIIGTLGPILGIITFSSIILLWYRYRARVNQANIFYFLLFSISVYLFFATTVHPWYVALPLVFCLFTKLRFPVVWSGLIMFTYINYSFVEYREVMLVVFAEYLIVFLFLAHEIRNLLNKKALLN